MGDPWTGGQIPRAPADRHSAGALNDGRWEISSLLGPTEAQVRAQRLPNQYPTSGQFKRGSSAGSDFKGHDEETNNGEPEYYASQRVDTRGAGISSAAQIGPQRSRDRCAYELQHGDDGSGHRRLVRRHGRDEGVKPVTGRRDRPRRCRGEDSDASGVESPAGLALSPSLDRMPDIQLYNSERDEDNWSRDDPHTEPSEDTPKSESLHTETYSIVPPPHLKNRESDGAALTAASDEEAKYDVLPEPTPQSSELDCLPRDQRPLSAGQSASEHPAQQEIDPLRPLRHEPKPHGKLHQPTFQVVPPTGLGAPDQFEVRGESPCAVNERGVATHPVPPAAKGDQLLRTLMARNAEALRLMRESQSSLYSGGPFQTTGRMGLGSPRSFLGGAASPGSSGRAIADVSRAVEIMRNLNPNIKDERLLLELLEDHIAGRPVTLGKEVAEVAQTSRILMPIVGNKEMDALAKAEYQRRCREGVQTSEEPGETGRAAFRSTHQFRLRRKAGSEENKEYVVVKLVESPCITACYGLLDRHQCQQLIDFIEDPSLSGKGWLPALTQTMFVKLEDQITDWSIPADCGDVHMGNEGAHIPAERPCEVKTFSVNQVRMELQGTVTLERLMTLAARAAGVSKVPMSQIEHIYFEKYTRGMVSPGIHFSNQRQGAVVFFLDSRNTENAGGAIALLSAGIEIMPCEGMAIYVPSTFPDTLPNSPERRKARKDGNLEEVGYLVPDLRTEIAVTALKDDSPLYLAVCLVALPVEEAEEG